MLVTSALPVREQTELAHKRLCHPNGRVLGSTPNLGLRIDKVYAETMDCLSCGIGKSKKKRHKHRPLRRKSRPCDRIHVDNTGPFKIRSLGGAKYSTYFTDDRSVLRYHVPRKNLDGESMAEAVREFEKVVVRGTRFRDAVLKILALRFDRGGEHDFKNCAKIL